MTHAFYYNMTGMNDEWEILAASYFSCILKIQLFLYTQYINFLCINMTTMIKRWHATIFEPNVWFFVSNIVFDISFSKKTGLSDYVWFEIKPLIHLEKC